MQLEDALYYQVVMNNSEKSCRKGTWRSLKRRDLTVETDSDMIMPEESDGF
ncbi:hypothetical protein M758_UG327300 [Ceratodon purpureus]|nr:hypothetical protein M758_UG327300 [Ceratodon purpureus]